jgi:hypothetical protein
MAAVDVVSTSMVLVDVVDEVVDQVADDRAGRRRLPVLIIPIL